MIELYKLAEGVYAITGLYHPFGDVNAGFVLTKSYVVHIDAGMTVRDGEHLLRASIEKFGRKPRKMWLVLTHNHSDHIFGMGIFKEAGAVVIAHEWVRQFLLHRTLPFFKRTIDTYKDYIVKMITKRTLQKNMEQIREIIGDVKLLHTPGQSRVKFQFIMKPRKCCLPETRFTRGRLQPQSLAVQKSGSNG